MQLEVDDSGMFALIKGSASTLKKYDTKYYHNPMSGMPTGNLGVGTFGQHDSRDAFKEYHLDLGIERAIELCSEEYAQAKKKADELIAKFNSRIDHVANEAKRAAQHAAASRKHSYIAVLDIKRRMVLDTVATVTVSWPRQIALPTCPSQTRLCATGIHVGPGRRADSA